VKNCYAGNNFAALLCTNGRVYTWGQNNESELGHGDTNTRSEPCLITTLIHDRIA